MPSFIPFLLLVTVSGLVGPACSWLPLTRPVTDDPQDDSLILQNANALMLAGSFTDARAEYRWVGERLAGRGDPLAIHAQFNQAMLTAAAGETNRSRDWFRTALSNANRFGRALPVLTAIGRANEALLLVRAGENPGALSHLELAVAELRRIRSGNTGLFLVLLDRLAEAVQACGDKPRAEALRRELRLRLRLLGMDRKRMSDGIVVEGGLLVPRVRIRRSPIGLTPLEQRRLVQFSEAHKYKFERHSADVKARTYENRLIDVNVFLRDLYAFRDDVPALRELSDAVAAGGAGRAGAGSLFIDIGPGIANLREPATTTVSIARDFPQMAVVALDLPDQVDIFLSRVAPEKRAAMAAVRNLSLLAGDGMAPLAIQLSRAAPRWAAQGRMPCPTSGPVFVRAANSIDIYFKWEELEPVLATMAGDFHERPLVVFFNRGILFKEAGRLPFRLLGQLSPLGFDHNVESHNRRGEDPYTLFPDY